MLASRTRLSSTLLFAVVVVGLLAAGCGGDDDDGFPGADEAPDDAEGLLDDLQGEEPDRETDGGDGDTTGPEFTVGLRGTDTQAAPPEFTTYPADCERSTLDDPSLGPVAVAAPPSWEVTGVSGGTGVERGATLRFTIGSVEKSLEIDILDPEGEPGDERRPPDTTDRAGVQDADVATTFAWAGEEIDLLFDGGRYTAFLPAMTIDGPLESFFPVGEYVLEVQFGASGRGDTAEVPDDEVVAVFESLETDRCLAESYADGLRDSTVEIES